jgi:UDP-N-acetylmuramyl pentapeptide synthase
MAMISFFLSIILFLINGVAVLRFYQIKDYLLKRVLAQFYFLSSKKIIFSKKEYFLYFLVFLSLLFSKTIQILKPDFLIFLIFLILFLRINLLKKIHFTLKAILVLFLAFLINFSLLFISQNSLIIFFLLSLWPLQFLIYTLSIQIFDICVKPYLLLLGNQVKKKIEKVKKENPNFKIIGICGSYGKSSTKEILVQLLKEKFKVLSTPPRINHEYALLKFLLKVKIENYNYLVLEFGSYYLGNIRWVTKFITPDIAYITGITKQHLFLFGSIEKIIEGEGLEILTWMKEGIVFINENHEYFDILKERYGDVRRSNIEVYFYGKDYKIREISLEKAVFEFKNKTFETNLIFPMQIENLIGALNYLSLIDDLENYREKIKNIELPEGFLKLKIITRTYADYTRTNADNNSLSGFVPDTLPGFKPDIPNNLHGYQPDMSPGLESDISGEHPGSLSGKHSGKNIESLRKSAFYIFDDSYNANPKGVFEGLKFFKELGFDYKVIIFNGLLELGKETKNIYQDLAKEFSAFDKIILTSNDFIEIFKEVLKDKVLLVKNSKELEIFLQSLKFEKVGIWIFNRFPERIKFFNQ